MLMWFLSRMLMWFLSRMLMCFLSRLYNAVSLTLVREQSFIRIIIIVVDVVVYKTDNPYCENHSLNYELTLTNC